MEIINPCHRVPSPSIASELFQYQTRSSDNLPYNFQSSGHRFILFYRWFSSTSAVYERGRIVAKFIADEMYARNAPVWLDQYHMPQDLDSDQVVQQIHTVFEQTPQVIILAGPGDWTRFGRTGDIHRWEWEMSLKSGKPIWLLLYDFPTEGAPIDKSDLVAHLAPFDAKLANLVSNGRVHIRTVMMENAQSIIRDIASDNVK